MLRHAIQSGWAAASRRDYELMFVRYAPDVEYEATAGIQSLDFPAAVRGQAAMAEIIAALSDVWDEWEFEPIFLVDAGDRMVSLGRFHAHGRASTVRLDSPWAQVLTFRNGLVAREQDVEDWGRALTLARLDPARHPSLLNHPAAGSPSATTGTQ
jgi:ketosteroid isomerase-like protein